MAIPETNCQTMAHHLIQGYGSICPKRDINLEKPPPLHPQSHPVKRFMEPLGKTMKIEYNNNHSETDALKMHACTELPKYTTSCNWSDTCRCAIQGWLMHFLPKEEGIRRTNPIGPTKRQVTKARKRNRKKNHQSIYRHQILILTITF